MDVAARVVGDGVETVLVPDVVEVVVLARLAARLLRLGPAVGVEDEEALRRQLRVHVAEVAEHLLALAEDEVGEVEGGGHVGARPAHPAHVPAHEPHPPGLLGPQGREVVVASPGQRLGVQVDPERLVPGVAPGPGAGEQRGAAEVLAQAARIAPELAPVHALEPGHVARGVLDRLLVERVAVRLLRPAAASGAAARAPRVPHPSTSSSGATSRVRPRTATTCTAPPGATGASASARHSSPPIRT